jgi:hypothetical protein
MYIIQQLCSLLYTNILNKSRTKIFLLPRAENSVGIKHNAYNNRKCHSFVNTTENCEENRFATIIFGGSPI